MPAHCSELALELASPPASVAPELLFDPAPLLDDPEPPLDDPEPAPELPLDAPELPFEPEVPLDPELPPELLFEPELPPEPLSAAASPALGDLALPPQPPESAAYQAKKRTAARVSISFIGFPKRTPSRPTRRNRGKRPNRDESKTERGAVPAYSVLNPIFAWVPLTVSVNRRLHVVAGTHSSGWSLNREAPKGAAVVLCVARAESDLSGRRTGGHQVGTSRRLRRIAGSSIVVAFVSLPLACGGPPSVREMEIAHAMADQTSGIQGIASSLCPIHTTAAGASDPVFGYRPAVNAIIDRLRNVLQ